MNTQQKFVKYLAVTLAILLITALIGGIVAGVLFLTGVYSPGSQNTKPSPNNTLISSFDQGNKNKNNYTAEDFSDRKFSFSEIENIELDSSIYTISFKKGDVDQIQIALRNVYTGYIVKQNGNTLILEEPDSFRNFSLNNLFDLLDNTDRQLEASICITVPQDFTAKKIELDGGVGNIDLENLAAEHLDIDAGVGDIKGFQVKASSVDIDGGVGNINFTDSSFDKATIDSGVGNTKLSLSAPMDSYRLSLEKGLGTIKLNGNILKFDDTYNENPKAPYSLEINGGVGNITINFADSF